MKLRYPNRLELAVRVVPAVHPIAGRLDYSARPLVCRRVRHPLVANSPAGSPQNHSRRQHSKRQNSTARLLFCFCFFLIVTILLVTTDARHSVLVVHRSGRANELAATKAVS